MKDYDQLRKETIEAINEFHKAYPKHKESEMVTITDKHSEI